MVSVRKQKHIFYINLIPKSIIEFKLCVIQEPKLYMAERKVYFQRAELKFILQRLLLNQLSSTFLFQRNSDLLFFVE